MISENDLSKGFYKGYSHQQLGFHKGKKMKRSRRNRRNRTSILSIVTATVCIIEWSAIIIGMLMASVGVITTDQYLDYALFPASALLPVMGFLVLMSKASS